MRTHRFDRMSKTNSKTKRVLRSRARANAGRTRKILYGEAKARGLRTESRAKINKLFDGVKPYEMP